MLRIVDYSVKSVAVLGNTYEHRNALKDIGGTFNRNLRVDTGIENGWIFPRNKESEVRDFVTEINKSSPNTPIIPRAPPGQRASDGGLTELVKRLQDRIVALERRVSSLEGNSGVPAIKKVVIHKRQPQPQPQRSNEDSDDDEKPRPRLLMRKK